MVPSQARRLAKYQVDPSPNGEAVAVGPRSNSPLPGSRHYSPPSDLLIWQFPALGKSWRAEEAPGSISFENLVSSSDYRLVSVARLRSAKNATASAGTAT